MPAYHEGELAIQTLAGVRDAAARLEAAISDRIPERARKLLTTFDAVAAGASATDGRVWASLWLGQPGLLACSADGGSVVVQPTTSPNASSDPVHSQCAAGRDIGMLAIDFETRRRLRINGTITAADECSLVVDVRESFLNCPKYIQRRRPARDHRSVSDPATVQRDVRDDALDAERMARVERADTAFIATMHPARGLDVSHRGGEPGFIRVLDERTLAFPDYRGNDMFTTLGNLAVSPRAGFAIVDFEAARVLSMTGACQFSDGPAKPARPAESGRVCTFTVESWIEFSMVGAASWLLLERSPFNPPVSDAALYVRG